MKHYGNEGLERKYEARTKDGDRTMPWDTCLVCLGFKTVKVYWLSKPTLSRGMKERMLLPFVCLLSSLMLLPWHMCVCVCMHAHTHTHTAGSKRSWWVVKRDRTESVHQGAKIHVMVKFIAISPGDCIIFQWTGVRQKVSMATKGLKYWLWLATGQWNSLTRIYGTL